MPLVIQKNHGNVYVKDARLYLIFTVFIFISAALIYRLFQMQVIDYESYRERAEKLHWIEKDIPPLRGRIFVNENNIPYPAVLNDDYYFVSVDPRKIQDPAKFIDTLAPILGLDEPEWKDLLRRVSKAGDPYEPVQRKVSRAEAEKLKSSGLDGLSFEAESHRKYPEKKIGGHVLGYVDLNGSGKYGIEGYYNEILTGVPGKLRSEKDAFGQSITIGEREIIEAIPGKDLVLTLDKSIQIKTCEEIKNGVEDYLAASGSVIVMEPASGKILAMCGYPDFDPEHYNKTEDINIFNNPAIFYSYEPGSIFKVITMASALDLKKISPETSYEDTGEVKIIGQKAIRNFDLKAHGKKTMTEVLELSLNTGAVFVENLIGKSNFVKYVKDFGFGEITGVGLSAESPGNISSLDKRGEIYAITASFGQGITVTPIQYLAAFSALVNGGRLMKPYMVEKIIDGGQVAQEIKPQMIRQVISQNASSLIIGMMVSVVEKGWDAKTKIQGYYVGGKTGTAQVAGAGGKYEDDTIHSFAGFAPAYNPKFAILVKLDKPKKYRFASETSTRVFKNIAEYILQYYNIPPDKP